jgi:hypothetical protein
LSGCLPYHFCCCRCHTAAAVFNAGVLGRTSTRILVNPNTSAATLLLFFSLQVYQENIYQDERPFVAARKVMKEMGEPYASGVELLSFHTVSKVRRLVAAGLYRGSGGGEGSGGGACCIPCLYKC